MTYALQYANWVLSPENAKKTGKLIKQACERFLSDLKRNDIYFDEEEAVKMVNFAERYCNQWEGDWRGKPFIMEPWQKFHLEQLFGWIRKDTGTRRFTKFYLQISKKNGKSSECALIADFHLFADERINTPKIFTAANNEEQAKICVNMAGRIIEQSEALFDFVQDGTVRLFNYKDNITEIVHTENDGFMKALSKEGGDKTAKTSGGKHGINASLGLVDEFGMSPDHGASGTIYTSMAARMERLMAYLTTAGYNQTGPCYLELRAQGIDVLNGTVKMDNYLPIIYEIDKPVDEDGKPKDITIQYLLDNPEVWFQSNPNLGVSVNAEYLREMLENARNLGGSTEVDVKTLNFNIWCDTPEVWVPHETWVKNSHGLTENVLKGHVCYGALEIVSGLSLNAFALIFPSISGDISAIKLLFFMPLDAIRNSNMRGEFERWADAGLIYVCPGNVVDNDFIFNKIMYVLGEYNLDSFTYNVGLENNDIVQSMIKSGLTGNPISTGYKTQNMPTDLWEQLLTGAKIEHFNNPVLSWMNGQTQIMRNKDGEKRVMKSEGRTAGITACVNALAQWKTVQANEPQDWKINSYA